MFAKKLFKNRKGIVGVEAAIVLIAFIIIAAALSYVVVNMGFYTTQKTKETMQSGLDESLSALQLDGVVTGKTGSSSNEIQYIVFPVKLSAGKAAMDLGNESVVVSVYLPDATLLNIYKGANSTTTTSLSTLLADNVNFSGIQSQGAMFALYNDDGDSVLESNEKAFLIVNLGSNTVADYETIKIEVRTAKGAALTIVRTAPGGMPQNSFVDLG
ncbi:MAG: archaellin/type IV pilin N-terminal domain-containing protein [Candidatus Bathyarchaeia archaeon]